MERDPRTVLTEYLAALEDIPEADELLDELRSELANGKLVVIENVGTKSESRSAWADVTVDERKQGRMVAVEPLTPIEALEATASVIRRSVVDPVLIVDELQDLDAEDPRAALTNGFFLASPESEVLEEDLPDPEGRRREGPQVSIEPLTEEEQRNITGMRTQIADLLREVAPERYRDENDG